jgi:hypothetical protein
MGPPGCPDTSVKIIKLHHVIYQESEDVIYTAAETGNPAQIILFSKYFRYFEIQREKEIQYLLIKR